MGSATTIQGPAYGRKCDIPTRLTFVVSGTTSTTATKFARVQATTDRPLIVEAQICVSTADGGTTPTMSVGVDSTANQLVNAASTATAATGGTFLPASNAIGKYRLTADADLYYKQGGTPDGAGITTLVLTLTPVNTSTTTGL